MAPIICQTKWLNPVTYINSNIPHKIEQVNILHALYDRIVIEIFEVKVVYKIYPKGLLSRHYGILVTFSFLEGGGEISIHFCDTFWHYPFINVVKLFSLIYRSHLDIIHCLMSQCLNSNIKTVISIDTLSQNIPILMEILGLKVWRFLLKWTITAKCHFFDDDFVILVNYAK